MSRGRVAKGHGGVARKTVTVRNQRGLHARAAAQFVKVGGRYDAEISVTKDGVTVPALSILGLMMLAAGPGARLLLRARGPDAREALAALARLVAQGFDEHAGERSRSGGTK